ncbi:hypothetical protein TEA_011048 [Camellia sinensis var. sinensis]|uniref:Uncharacterized protein n=1 Tax=Camellia sinensis var. sinensis TaxID=542762 RepID=A0A4S4DQ26_CAMSN|nr:hypothetical protein TEA_011048 [Camellia sinensis var. sinensis]
MEFKFRAKDGQASTTHVPPSSTIGYFTQQALRGPYTIPLYFTSLTKSEEKIHIFPGYSFPDFGHSSDFIRNPSNVREAIQRELEKERIREEIIATEIVRKRMLEAELRREMALAREMALRRGEGFSTFSAQSAMRFEPRLSLLHQSEGRFLEERLALSLEERLGYQAHHSVGGFEMMRFTRNAEPKISEIMPPSEVSTESHFRDDSSIGERVGEGSQATAKTCGRMEVRSQAGGLREVDDGNGRSDQAGSIDFQSFKECGPDTNEGPNMFSCFKERGSSIVEGIRAFNSNPKEVSGLGLGRNVSLIILASRVKASESVSVDGSQGLSATEDRCRPSFFEASKPVDHS